MAKKLVVITLILVVAMSLFTVNAFAEECNAINLESQSVGILAQGDFFAFGTHYGAYRIPYDVIVDWAHSANPANPTQYAYYVEGTQAVLKHISDEYVIDCDPVWIDGIYGNNTYNAIYNFQYDRGLVADGAAGYNTYSAMRNMM